MVERLIFVLACVGLVMFPFPAILFKVITNGIFFIITGELNEAY